ncbi:hypothetical protein CCYA_CCYA11G3063 [Cyanidiococcus yangmingshanensis]|nr:hypothetical protein CCYA_CCYA11G3063 [Cyanidiococcus yangmingshanensis]
MFVGPGSALFRTAGCSWTRERDESRCTGGVTASRRVGRGQREPERQQQQQQQQQRLPLTLHQRRRPCPVQSSRHGLLQRRPGCWSGPRACLGPSGPNGDARTATGVPSSLPTSLRLEAGELSRSVSLPAAVLDAEAIERVLPHRYPFLLVDKVLEYVHEERVVAVKNVSYNEQYFQGHFPSKRIMPGVLQLEALAQCCGLMLLEPSETGSGSMFLFASVEGLRWRRPVRPGDVLVMECEVVALRKRFGIAKCRGRGYVDGDLVVEADMTFACSK